MEENQEFEIRQLLTSVFGESEGESDDELEWLSESSTQWKRIEQVKGLWLCRDFLSKADEQRLLKDIEAEAWFIGPETNQAMRFGDLPVWAVEITSLVRSSLVNVGETSKEKPLSDEILWREPLFNQMIVNSYEEREGIPAHIDLLRFEDGIAILSLISPRVMTFKLAKKQQHEEDVAVPVLLRPCDLLLMSTEARYEWTHEINPELQVWNGLAVPPGRRISVTLRHLRRQE